MLIDVNLQHVQESVQIYIDDKYKAIYNENFRELFHDLYWQTLEERDNTINSLVGDWTQFRRLD